MMHFYTAVFSNGKIYKIILINEGTPPPPPSFPRKMVGNQMKITKIDLLRMGYPC